MRHARLASLAPLLLLLLPGLAQAQLVPKAAPLTPVESANLTEVGDVYPGEAWEARPLAAAVDQARLTAAMNAAFAQPAPVDLPGTRAVVIVQHGALVYERYATGYSASSRFMGWSLAKTLVNAGIGILAGDGRLSLLSNAALPQWQGENDPRHTITVRQLLTMTSGLSWPDSPEVASAKAADVQMLFGSGRDDMAAYAARKRLKHDPGQIFNYSSGSSELLSAILSRTLAPNAKSPAERREATKQFFDRRLFGPLGIKSAVLEYDKAGTFAGGSYVHMTAQDYARLGYLYLRGGEWAGQPILPANWSETTQTPGGAQNSSAYGAHFWLMTRRTGDDAFPPTIADDPKALLALGNYGQAILIVPSRALVIVRLGNSPPSATPAVQSFLREIVACFPAS